MNEKEIRLKLNKIESWMMMTCESCVMPDKLLPLINDIRKLLDAEEKQKTGQAPGENVTGPSSSQ
jgi:hypothetical protein